MLRRWRAPSACPVWGPLSPQTRSGSECGTAALRAAGHCGSARRWPAAAARRLLLSLIGFKSHPLSPALWGRGWKNTTPGMFLFDPVLGGLCYSDDAGQPSATLVLAEQWPSTWGQGHVQRKACLCPRWGNRDGTPHRLVPATALTVSRGLSPLQEGTATCEARAAWGPSTPAASVGGGLGFQGHGAEDKRGPRGPVATLRPVAWPACSVPGHPWRGLSAPGRGAQSI